MREIKFRGRHLRLPGLYGDWIYGSLYSDGENDNEPIIIERVGTGKYYPVVPATVGQFTGLCDCKGQDIYEGDIVAFGDFFRALDVDYEYWHGVVKWSFEGARFVLDKLEFDEEVCNDELLVIGNIHDNPELLENTR